MVLLVILAGVVCGSVALVATRSIVSGDAPLDVERPRRWLLTHTPPWVARPLGTIDRRVAGGVTVGASFVVVSAAAIVVGWIFSGVDDGTGVARWDVAAAEWGRDNATDTSTTVLGAVTDLGGSVPLIVAMVLLGVYHSVRHDDRGPALYLAVVGIGITALNNGLKFVIDRDRPDIAQLTGHAGSSFPSGHSAAAAACWAALAFVLVRRSSRPTRTVAGTLVVTIAVAVAVTRVLLGVHWLSDVVAGVLVGWAWFLATTIVVGGRSLRLGEPAERLDTRVDADVAVDANARHEHRREDASR